MNKKRLISIHVITLIMAFFSIVCVGKENSEKLKSKAIKIMAEALNEDSTNILIRRWMRIGYFDKKISYVASFYKADKSEENDYLGLFEMTEDEVFHMTCMNSSILNKKDNSTDKKRIYEIVYDYRNLNGFCLSNGETRYYLIIRPQENAREVLLSTAFRRKLKTNKEMAIYEYSYKSNDRKTFESFPKYKLSQFGHEEKTSIINIPRILNNDEEFFFLAYDYGTDTFNASITHYRPGQEKEVITLTEMELIESSYRTVQFKAKGRDSSQKEKEVYFFVESSMEDRYTPRPQYPDSIRIADKGDKGITHKVTTEVRNRWSKCQVGDRRANMLMSYYLPQDAQVIDVYTTDFNNDSNNDYLVTAIYKENKERQSGIFIFTENEEGLKYIGMEKLGQMLISSTTDEEDIAAVNWNKSLVNPTDYIFTVKTSNSRINESESFVLRFNSKNRPYMTESWRVGINSPNSFIEINWKSYSEAYVFTDYMNKASKLKTDFDYTERIPKADPADQEDWFLTRMLSNRYSDEKKKIMAKAVYNISSFSTFLEEKHFNIIRMLCQWRCINEAYELFHCLDKKIVGDDYGIWDYSVSKYWAAYFAYIKEDYVEALEYLNAYVEECTKCNCISMKREATQLRKYINNKMY